MIIIQVEDIILLIVQTKAIQQVQGDIVQIITQLIKTNQQIQGDIVLFPIQIIIHQAEEVLEVL